MIENLHLYFTSDLHSHFENWPKIMTYLKGQKSIHASDHTYSLIMDNGDHMDRVNPISEATAGAANVDLLSRAAFDVCTFGNNEGITLDRDQFFHLYDEATFDVVCANVKSIDHNNPKWLKSYKMFQTPSGINIAIIGLTAPFNHFYQPMGWHAQDPLKALKLVLIEVKPVADIIVVLSHLGIDQDEQIAQYFKEVDIIVGGHTHHLFESGQRINQSILGAVGKFGLYVGKVSLNYDHSKKQIIHKAIEAINITDLPDDINTTKQLMTFKEQADLALDEIVCELKEPLEVNWFKETQIIKALTKTLRSWTHADVAMLNAGLLLESFPKGPVTLKDIHRICPHPINPCVVEISGQELLELIRLGLQDHYVNYAVKGFGFRGKVMGRLIYEGIEIEFKDTEANEPFIRSVWIGSQALDVHKQYKVATADMFTFGQLAPQIARARNKKFFMPEFVRDLLSVTLKNIEMMGMD